MDLAGAGVFITGGSSGIGKAAARMFLEQGANVAIYSRDKKEVARAVAELKAHVNVGTKKRHPLQSRHEFILGFTGDVTNAKQLEAAVKAARAKFGRLDVMVNNAGVFYRGSYLDVAKFDDAQVDVNVKGVLNGTRAALPIFLKQKRGQFVNLASIVVHTDRVDLATYSATKSFVAHFSHCLRNELEEKKKRTGVRIGVSVVYPSKTNTQLFRYTGARNMALADPADKPARAIVDCAKHNWKDANVGLAVGAALLAVFYRAGANL